MREQSNIDFAKIDWQKIDREKAEFIYNEAIARLDSIHRNIDVITNKALSMLSFSVPVLSALTGYFFLQWGKLSAPLLAVSVCAASFLFAILVLLLLVLWPRGINSAQGEPSTYLNLKDNYYLNSLDNIFKGNIQTLHRYIIEDRALMDLRANLFSASVVLFTAFPLIAAGVWAVFSVCAKN